jgi:hypothetical protein
MPNESDPSNAERVLPFIVPFDPRVPEIEEAENEVVRERFENLVSDTFLNHASSSINGRVVLGREDESEADTEWSLGVQQDRPTASGEESEEESTEVTRSEISIQKKVRGEGRDIFIYRLGQDGTVGRFDRGDPSEDIPFTRDEILNGPDPSRRPNYDPISLTEMEELEAFVSQPGWKIPESYAAGVATIIRDRQAMRAPDFPPKDL